ncbi:DUF6230 family protein [Nocardioides sp. Kera G14]|uniref:DUF6230 family protein n=1 Tax=Nocardioides sp. Kera G14 TaxID=2884264 RepID=UPI001D12F72A|nr:DUF6230 family protein [Nocardioides sp. Kera G14]UDY23200.1 DUF6230 family protein [Nocardioides sp. Kera G14]
MKSTRGAAKRRSTQRGSLATGLRDLLIGRAGDKAAEISDLVAERHQTMLDLSVVGRRGTRKRALLPVVAGLLGLAGMFTAVSQNVLAVNFTTGNNKFRLYSNYLDAQSAAGFLTSATRQDGTGAGVAELGIKSARLAGLCAIAKDNILGGLALKITAGDTIPATYSGTSVPDGVATRAIDADGSDAGTAVGDSPDEKAGALTGTSLTNAITATNLYINADALSGYGNLISGLNLGQSADTVEASAGVDISQTPTAGNFGLYAQQLNVAGLNGDTYGLNLAGAITLPKLKLSVVGLPWGLGSTDGISQSACG